MQPVLLHCRGYAHSLVGGDEVVMVMVIVAGVELDPVDRPPSLIVRWVDFAKAEIATWPPEGSGMTDRAVFKSRDETP